MGSVLGPKAQISVNGNLLNVEVTEFIRSVEVDLSQTQADLITLTVANPVRDVPGERRGGGLLWNESIVFMPGNVVEVFLSYDNDEPIFVGAGIVRKWLPDFPEQGQPVLTVKALDATCIMMDGDDDIDAKAARTFGEGFTFPEIANAIFNDHGFNTSNVDLNTNTPAVAHAVVKKAGTSDYQFVMGLALSLGWRFYVKWNREAGGRWDAYFRPPTSDDSLKKEFTWGPRWGRLNQPGGNLLSFSAEFAVQDRSTDVEVYYYDRGAGGVWRKVTWPESKSSKTKDWEYKGDRTTTADDLKAVTSMANLVGPNDSRGLRIQAAGASVEVIPLTGFQSEEDAKEFARGWWRARQDLLLQGTGSIVGWPFMQPGQVHTLRGLGTALSGDWYIAECTHKFSANAPYRTDILARKVIP